MPLMVQRGWVRNRGTAALPGYFISDTPWAGVKTVTASESRAQQSTSLSGGLFRPGTGAQNDEYTRDLQFQDGTYKIAQIGEKNTNRGIASVQLDGVEKASIDWYNAASADAQYQEVTGIALTAGLKVAKTAGTTKNASSSGYVLFISTEAWVRTGA